MQLFAPKKPEIGAAQKTHKSNKLSRGKTHESISLMTTVQPGRRAIKISLWKQQLHLFNPGNPVDT